uniref:Reverse transcriptase domain-containing protein n=1 Tax=Nicotiana tabacum TaxID=4097 RepID=A0A1S3Z7U9_TOBAC|nr:PREDICTED: uncharacterized protein LOC107783960 [Nicotiana tabacum]
MGNRHFKYFNMWSMDPDFKDKVAESWNKEINGTKMYQIVGKVNRLKRVLKQLNRTKFSNIEGKEEQAKKDLEECQQHTQQNPLNQGLIEREQQLASRYRRNKKASDQFLRKKSKVQWLKQSDKNNKYFHSYMKERRNANRILSIKAKGNRVTNVEEIVEVFVEFYSNLLGSTTDKREHVYSPLVREGKIVTEGQRQFLTEEFTEKEVKQALWKIDGEKAPGPDGYRSKFFKDSWEITGKALKEAALEFFESGKLLKTMNRTVSQLKTILPDIISENQIAFVAGRTIIQNILICQDLVRLYKRKAATKSCLIKIDLKKAYDSIECEFVEEMLHALNFPMKFIRWIMEYISTPQYTVAINGGFYGNIKGKRGLRQGDPISPLLFVIYMEYFSRIMKHVTQMEGFRFHTKCRSLQLNHL